MQARQIPCVLVVEDSPTQRAELEIVLESEGFEVRTASDGLEGFKAFQAGEFDLVLSDVMMPGLTGYELCRRIKGEPAGRDVPVILLTSLANPEDIIEGLDCGADNFITKPYEPDYLLARIRTVLNNKCLRGGRKLQVGVTLSLLGRAVNISSEKEQILDLLISTFEEYLRMKERENERRVAEEALQRSLGLVQSALNTLPSYVAVLDEAGTLIAVNAAWEQFSRDGCLFGASCEVGESYLQVCERVAGKGQSAASKVAAGVRAVLGRAREAFELEYRCMAGRDHSFIVRVRPFEDSGRMRAVVVHEDVSEFRRAEEALLRRDAVLEAVAFASEQFLTADPDEVMKPVLERLGRAAGISRVFVYENSSRSETPEVARYEWTVSGIPSLVAHPVLRTAASGESGLGSWREVLGRGGVVQVNVDEAIDAERAVLEVGGVKSSLIVPIFVGTTWWGNFGVADVERAREWSPAEVDAMRTAARILGGAIQRRKAEEALRQSEEQLRQAQKMEAIGRLAGGIAHDFNNLLTVITGYSEMILRQLPERDPVRRDVTEIHGAGQRAAQLTHQLLAFSRKQVIEPRKVDLSASVSTVEKMLRRLLGEDVELVTRLDSELWPVLADPGQMEQVLLNLAVNARDAMPDGGRIMIETSNVELVSEEIDPQFDADPGPHVLLSVSDTGSGIDGETLAHIFEPFFTTKEQGKGTGLGLSTVYGIVKHSGGTIAIETELGRGTTFKVYLPCASEAAQSSVPEEELAFRAYGAETILLVEDEDALRRLVTLMLEQAGYTVLAASDGVEALRLFEEDGRHVDLVVTDLVMPKLGGRELVKSLAERFPGVRALYMSGYSEKAATLHDYLGEGATFLDKPFTVDVLVKRVREVLDQPRVISTGLRRERS